MNNRDLIEYAAFAAFTLIYLAFRVPDWLLPVIPPQGLAACCFQ